MDTSFRSRFITYKQTPVVDGIVHLECTDRRTNKPVVAVVHPVPKGKEESFKKQYASAIEKAANHKNLCRLLEVICEDSLMYIVSEDFACRNLRSFAEKHRNKDYYVESIVKVMHSLMDLTGYLQSVGKKFSTLCPEHILLDFDRESKKVVGVSVRRTFLTSAKAQIEHQFRSAVPLHHIVVDLASVAYFSLTGLDLVQTSRVIDHEGSTIFEATLVDQKEIEKKFVEALLLEPSFTFERVRNTDFMTSGAVSTRPSEEFDVINADASVETPILDLDDTQNSIEDESDVEVVIVHPDNEQVEAVVEDDSDEIKTAIEDGSDDVEVVKEEKVEAVVEDDSDFGFDDFDLIEKQSVNESVASWVSCQKEDEESDASDDQYEKLLLAQAVVSKMHDGELVEESEEVETKTAIEDDSDEIKTAIEDDSDEVKTAIEDDDEEVKTAIEDDDDEDIKTAIEDDASEAGFVIEDGDDDAVSTVTAVETADEQEIVAVVKDEKVVEAEVIKPAVIECPLAKMNKRAISFHEVIKHKFSPSQLSPVFGYSISHFALIWKLKPTLKIFDSVVTYNNESMIIDHDNCIVTINILEDQILTIDFSANCGSQQFARFDQVNQETKLVLAALEVAIAQSELVKDMSKSFRIEIEEPGSVEGLVVRIMHNNDILYKHKKTKLTVRHAASIFKTATAPADAIIGGGSITRAMIEQSFADVKHFVCFTCPIKAKSIKFGL